MDRIQNSAVEDDEVPIPTPKSRKHKKASSEHNKAKEQPKSPPPSQSSNHEDPVNKYSREANIATKHERHKRATRLREENRNTCSLYIQTDPLIWKHIREGFPEVRYKIK